MAEAAPRARMTVAEFMTFDDGTAVRYELIEGVPVAMNPPAAIHVVMTMNVVRVLDRQLVRPCRVYTGGGVARDDDSDTWREPDVFVSCLAPGRNHFAAPRSIIEILSPSTAREDRTAKLDFYKSFACLEAIVFVWQEKRRAELHRRIEHGWLVTDTIGQGTIEFPPDGLSLTLDQIYEDVDVPS